MPTTTPDGRRRPTPALSAALSLLTGLLLAGCTRDADPGPSSTEAGPVEVVRSMDKVLRKRARAVLAQDWTSFAATLDDRRARFVEGEQVFFDNLTQLPLSEFSYRVEEGTVVRGDGGYHAVVQVRLQLDGYDTVPVVRPKRFHFTQARGQGLRVASHRDRAWEQRNDVDVQPWDSGPITVGSGQGVLAIFDERTAPRSAEMIAAVEQGIGQVGGLVPYGWSGRVVVYALSDTVMLEGLDDLPAADPGSLDAVAFPVPARPDDPDADIASTRFLLHPRMLSTPPGQLARLIRHELTHVALGERDDEVPTWLGEGIAEWVSVQSLPIPDRLISQEAIDLARRGISRLPADEEFHGEDQAANYGISWWACEAIVDIHGEQVLWQLVDELAASSPADQPDRQQQLLQMGAAQLAREAERRLLATYG